MREPASVRVHVKCLHKTAEKPSRVKEVLMAAGEANHIKGEILETQEAEKQECKLNCLNL